MRWLTRDDVRAVETELLWEPLPEVPRALRRPVAHANRRLVAYVRRKDQAALREMAATLDRVVDHPALAEASTPARLALLNRTGIAHNWLGVAGRGDRVSSLGRAIEVLRRGMAEADGFPTMAWRLHTNFSNCLVNRYQQAGADADLDLAVSEARDAIRLAASAASADGAALASSALAHALRVRHRRDGSPTDLAEAADIARAAVELCPEGPRRSYMRFALSEFLQVRYDVAGSLADLDEAEALLRMVLAEPESPIQLTRAGVEGTLATVLRRRFSRTGDPQDIDDAIDLMRKDDSASNNPARLTNLGNALLDRFDALHREEDLQDAVDAQRAAVDATPEGDWQLASRYNNLGNVLSSAAYAMDNRDLSKQAVDAYRQSLELTSQSAPERASREYNLGRTLLDLNGDKRTGALVDEAASAFRGAVAHGLEGAVEWALSAAKVWGRWAAERASWAEAAEAYRAGVVAAHRLHRVQLAREEQETWLAESQGIPGEAAYAMARAGLPEDALEVLERGRTMLLSDALDRDRADLRQLELRHPELAAEFRESAEKVDAASHAGGSDASEVRAARHRLDDVIAAIQAHPGFETFLLAPELSDVLDSALAVLPADSVLVYLAAAPAGGVALVVGVDRDKREVVAVELPRCTVEACAVRTSALIAARARVAFDPTALDGPLDAVTRWLWSAVMGPVLDAAPDRSRFALVPCGLLCLLPLHAAWTDEGRSRRYVADDAVITYAPGARMLVESTEAAERAGKPRRTLVVSDPQPSGLPRIGFAAAESAWTLRGPDNVVLAHGAAVRAAVLKVAPAVDVLHFACHGASRADDPLNSGIFLAGDDLLSLRDLLRVRLAGSGDDAPGTRLVVLSACDTDQPGLELPDEVISLPTGLLQAGAIGVVATQWAVRSLAAALLVAAFSASVSLQNADPPQALARAQRWLRDTTNGQKTADLEFWSADLGGDESLQSDRHELVRALKLRDPLALDFSAPTAWAAACFHGA